MSIKNLWYFKLLKHLTQDPMYTFYMHLKLEFLRKSSNYKNSQLDIHKNVLFYT